MLFRMISIGVLAWSNLVVVAAFGDDNYVEEFRRQQAKSFLAYADQFLTLNRVFESVNKELSASQDSEGTIPQVKHRRLVFESPSKFVVDFGPVRGAGPIHPVEDYQDLIPHYSEFYVPHHTEFAPTICPTLPHEASFNKPWYCPSGPHPMHLPRHR